MESFIACLLLFALFMLGLYHEHKEKEWKERNDWIYCSERRLLRISDAFEHECSDATDIAFKKYAWNIRFCEWHCTIEDRNSLVLSKHTHTINSLEKDYIDNLAEKFSAGYAYRGIDRLPAYLIEEYNQRIQNIASRYRRINFTMMMRIRTLSPEYIKETNNEDN